MSARTVAGTGLPVAVRARSPVGRNGTRENHLFVIVHEPAVDTRFAGTSPHGAGVGAPAHEQLDGVDDECLTRTGLARHRGHTRTEYEPQIGDDAEVANNEFFEHEWLLGQPELFPHDAVEVAVLERHELRGMGAGGARHGRAAA